MEPGIKTGLSYFIKSTLIAALIVAISWVISKGEFKMLAILGALPFLIGIIYYLFLKPAHALHITIVMAFLAIGLTRYVDAPLGLLVDICLLLTVLVALFQTKSDTKWHLLNNSLVYLTLIWLLYCILQIFNPEARSFAAWFYAVRGVALYMALTIPLTLLYFNKNKNLNTFFKLTFILTLVGALWGLKQMVFGVDSFENAWLNTGPRQTHVLAGQLRIFSFFSDAGQFGAGMAQVGVIASILGFGPFSWKKKIFFFFMAVICFWMMLLSGTRGSFFVPVVGFMTYFFVIRNFKILLLGLMALFAVFAFLKYTNAGNDIFQIRRLRSALNPEDASLQVRVENQRRYREYLSTRPFGGGIGTAGSWGKRFSPGTFLADTPTDSWYVKIWGETGIVGLSYHVFMILFILFIGIRFIWRIRDPVLKTKIIALYSGFAGIAFASYGNPLLGQMPTGIILYMSWAFIYLSPYLDDEIANQPKNEQHTTGIHHQYQL